MDKLSAALTDTMGHAGIDCEQERHRLTCRVITGCLLSMIVISSLYVMALFLRAPVDNWPLFGCNASLLVASIAIALTSMNARATRESVTRAELEAARRQTKLLAAALAEKTEKLRSLNGDIEDLLHVASHELRAPLINVQGFSRELQLGLTQLQRSNGRSPEAHAALADAAESLQFILAAVGRMDTLITSLLNVSRIGSRTNPTERVDLNAIVRRVADSFQLQLTEKQIALEIESLPPVAGDPMRLGQLFGNLIDNAIKYMGSATERRIAIGAAEVGQERRVFVRDTGPGIAPENHEQVFRLFRRLGNGGSPGEGIGLTMVRKIAEKHGGRVWIESTPGSGTTFWIALPSTPPRSTLEIESRATTRSGPQLAG